MTDAVDAAAIQFPEATFALLDVPHDALEHPVRGTSRASSSTEAEASYLGGYLAARMVEREQRDQIIGSVGGVRVPAVENFIAGYQAGARKANPDVTVANSYTDDFMDPAKGRSALSMNPTDPCRLPGGQRRGLRVLQAAKEYGIWGIGVDVDESYLGPHILTSAVKRLDAGVFETVRELQLGTLSTGGTSVFSLQDGGVGLGEISPEVPSSVLQELETIRSQIVAGGRSRCRPRSHSSLALDRNPDATLADCDVRRCVTDREHVDDLAALGVDPAHRTLGVVGDPHRFLADDDADRLLPDRDRMRHRGSVRVDGPEASPVVGRPHAAQPDRSREESRRAPRR